MTTRLVVQTSAKPNVAALVEALEVEGFKCTDALGYENYLRQGPAVVLVIEGDQAPTEARVRELAATPGPETPQGSVIPMRSPNGKVWLLSVSDLGVLSVAEKPATRGARRVQ